MKKSDIIFQFLLSVVYIVVNDALSKSIELTPVVYEIFTMICMTLIIMFSYQAFENLSKLTKKYVFLYYFPTFLTIIIGTIFTLLITLKDSNKDVSYFIYSNLIYMFIVYFIGLTILFTKNFVLKRKKSSQVKLSALNLFMIAFLASGIAGFISSMAFENLQWVALGYFIIAIVLTIYVFKYDRKNNI